MITVNKVYFNGDGMLLYSERFLIFEWYELYYFPCNDVTTTYTSFGLGEATLSKGREEKKKKKRSWFSTPCLDRQYRRET